MSDTESFTVLVVGLFSLLNSIFNLVIISLKFLNVTVVTSPYALYANVLE